MYSLYGYGYVISIIECTHYVEWLYWYGGGVSLSLYSLYGIMSVLSTVKIGIDRGCEMVYIM